jgi:hypothetical protein
VYLFTHAAMSSYPNPIGMNFEETLQGEESRKGGVHVVQNLSKELRLLVVLQDKWPQISLLICRPHRKMSNNDGSFNAGLKKET